ncbi:hypothetical protein PF011_g9909 [Phytophthora fragariae]|uniref:Uncharacterized protein n=1 Tax=Phytophthora fragariae TaxID=53985 RepID=A0A6A3L3M7_9STRA|nr:hypothetical protein PF011_g9909 [Phytophthora fragariae]KAE9358932.1 hypothetical protein PF008_g2454 [Phytophthora fragariae]
MSSVSGQCQPARCQTQQCVALRCARHRLCITLLHLIFLCCARCAKFVCDEGCLSGAVHRRLNDDKQKSL